MREIKFRAWDKDGKEYIDFIGLDIPIESLSRIDSNIEWEQYTGLKDKNCREIYEGDIVKICDGEGDIPYEMNIGDIYEVKYDECGFWPFMAYDNSYGKYLDAEWCEVIGNIHENPELLNAKG